MRPLIQTFESEYNKGLYQNKFSSQFSLFSVWELLLCVLFTYQKLTPIVNDNLKKYFFSLDTSTYEKRYETILLVVSNWYELKTEDQYNAYVWMHLFCLLGEYGILDSKEDEENYNKGKLDDIFFKKNPFLTSIIKSYKYAPFIDFATWYAKLHSEHLIIFYKDDFDAGNYILKTGPMGRGGANDAVGNTKTIKESLDKMVDTKTKKYYLGMKDIHGDSRWELFEKYGAYCGYCEKKVWDTHVEHTLASAVFPSYLNDWDNFILACPTCNQTKGDKPSKEKLRDEVFKNISPFDPAPDRNIFGMKFNKTTSTEKIPDVVYNYMFRHIQCFPFVFNPQETKYNLYKDDDLANNLLISSITFLKPNYQTGSLFVKGINQFSRYCGHDK